MNTASGPMLQQMWDLASGLPVKLRKRVILLCRAQDVIYDEPFNLLCIQTGLTDTSRSYERTLSSEEVNYRRLVHLAHDWIKSPLLSSILLDICRSSPLSPHLVQQEKLSAWGKEISVCERSERPLSFNYKCWFDPHQHASTPFMAGVPPNPSMAWQIHFALCRWKLRVQETLLYPRMSTKMISKATVRNWENIKGREWVVDEEEGGVEMTQVTLEREYHQTGLVVEGPCEIRQKWYTSGITPRTYFAQGGTAYNTSKFIQEPAGMLVEELETTHPITRLSPARISLTPATGYLRIYDLSTFTSNHWECKYFVDELANWCRGTIVEIVDAAQGILQVDLGDLLADYNHSMNYFPSYSVENVLSEIEGFLNHNQAGFLGVYGNINFSTFLHGGSLLMVLRAMNHANVAGDDAHYNEEHGMEDIADRVIEGNGVVEWSKAFRGDERGAVCLKRGLITVDGRVLPKLMAVFPSWTSIGRFFKYRPPQFQLDRISKPEAQHLVGNEMYRFLRAVYAGQIEQDLEEVTNICRMIYEALRLPKTGSLPPYGEHLIPVLPDNHLDLLQIDPLRLLLRHHFSNGAVFPKMFQEGDSYVTKSLQLNAGYQWKSTSSKALKYLEQLEYVQKEEIEEVLWGEEAYERFVDVFESKKPLVYEYLCLRDIPPIFWDLEYDG